MRIIQVNKKIWCLWVGLAFVLAQSVTVNAQVSVEMSAGVTTALNGAPEVSLSGKWLNNGTLEAGNGTVVFLGNVDQEISNATGAFYAVDIAKPAGNLICLSALEVTQELNVLSGDVLLNGFVISMPNGGLIEAEGETVFGTSGQLYTLQDFGVSVGELSFGLSLSDAGNVGLSSLSRGHSQQSGNGNLAIARWFDLSAAVTLPATSDIVFHYDDSELAGQDETALQLFNSMDDGTTWVELTGALDTAGNTFTASDVGNVGMLTLSAFQLAVVYCPWDLDFSGHVGTGDLLIVIGAFASPTGDGPTDFNGDGETGTADLLELLGVFGTTCG